MFGTWKPASAGLMACMCAAMLTGCASAPHLKSSTLKGLGKTEVVYVTPQDDIVITDPAMTRLAHLCKFVTLDYLFGGIGVVAYFAGKKSPGGMEGRIDASRNVFTDQHWEERMHATAQAAGDASRLQGATWIVMDQDPTIPDMQKLAMDGGFDSLVTVVPEMQMADEGDHLRMVVQVTLVTIHRDTSCRSCGDYMHTSELTNTVKGSEQLVVSQGLVAVDGGNTWEEQKQAGHKLHDLTEGDFAMFWLRGDQPPLKTFMDAAFQSLQAQLTVYFGGQAEIPALLPTVKMVIPP